MSFDANDDDKMKGNTKVVQDHIPPASLITNLMN